MTQTEIEARLAFLDGFTKGLESATRELEVKVSVLQQEKTYDDRQRFRQQDQLISLSSMLKGALRHSAHMEAEVAAIQNAEAPQKRRGASARLEEGQGSGCAARPEDLPPT